MTDTPAANGQASTGLEFLSEWPRGSDLVRDYISGTPAAVGLYGGHFADRAAYRKRAESVDRRFDRAARERAARALHVRGDEARARIGRWVASGGYAVTTGQQPGLLTGPLFAVYKALTAIHLARALEAGLGKPVLPVFWVASEDHDWAEAGHTHLIEPVGHTLRRVDARAADADGGADRPLFRVPLAGHESLLADLEPWLPKTAFLERYAESWKEGYGDGRTLPGGMVHLMLDLLGDQGLCVCQAHDPAIKRASAHVLRGELERAAEREEALRDRAQAIEAAGYAVQVPILDGALNLFGETAGGERQRVYRSPSGFHLHPSNERTEGAAVEREIDAASGTISPNVLLRPVVESAAFPTLAYVGGPGELAYFAQIGPLFEAHGIQVPVVHPRISVTVLEPKIRKILDRFDMEPRALSVPAHVLSARWAELEIPQPVSDALEALSESVRAGMDVLAAATEPLDPTLSGPVHRARSQTLKALHTVRTKVMRAIKRKGETSLAQLARAQAALYPDGKPQERVLSPYSFLVRYGPTFLSELDDEVSRHLRGVHGLPADETPGSEPTLAPRVSKK